MFPSIWPGARLEIKPIACSELCVGMVVAFERAEQIVVHRVIDIDQQFFQTQGDSLLQADERCDYSALIGVVVSVNDKGQHRALRKRRRAKIALLTNNMAATVSPRKTSIEFSRVGDIDGVCKSLIYILKKVYFNSCEGNRKISIVQYQSDIHISFLEIQDKS